MGRILKPAEPWKRWPKGECRHDGHGTAMAKKIRSEVIQVRLWQFDKLAGVAGTGSSRLDHRRAHLQSRGVHRPSLWT